MQFSELTETRVQAFNHISNRVLGWTSSWRGLTAKLEFLERGKSCVSIFSTRLLHRSTRFAYSRTSHTSHMTFVFFDGQNHSQLLVLPRQWWTQGKKDGPNGLSCQIACQRDVGLCMWERERVCVCLNGPENAHASSRCSASGWCGYSPWAARAFFREICMFLPGNISWRTHALNCVIKTYFWRCRPFSRPGTGR